MEHPFIFANKLCTLHVHKFADGETKVTIEKDISNLKITLFTQMVNLLPPMALMT